ncbi:MAG: ABC transporter permease [Chloroflexi bacterium]|nr:ABC transporter permease [Chloroflexota bacterium]MCL5107526.1 ABC transporter permease [Chloroflexota bacterium]
MNQNVAALLVKEFRQLPRKRGAVLSAVLLPLAFCLGIPLLNIVTMGNNPNATNMPVGVNLPPGMSSMKDTKQMLTGFLLPFMIMISGLMLPSLLATYTIIAERERRTLELLVALPVSVRDIITAKLGAVLAVGVAITVPLLIIDSAVMIYFGLGSFGDALLLLWLLVASLAYSTAGALLVGLLAKDFRTANNVLGALVGPFILIAMGFIFVLPPVVAPLALGAFLLLLTAAAIAFSLRWLTFERLLS